MLDAYHFLANKANKKPLELIIVLFPRIDIKYYQFFLNFSLCKKKIRKDFNFNSIRQSLLHQNEIFQVFQKLPIII